MLLLRTPEVRLSLSTLRHGPAGWAWIVRFTYTNAAFFLARESCCESVLTERLERENQIRRVYLDLGAHIGIHALVASRESQRLTCR